MVSPELLRRYPFFAFLDDACQIEPYRLTSTARAATPCRVLKIDAAALRALCDGNRDAGYALMRHAAKAAIERLHFTRVQLAAARA